MSFLAERHGRLARDVQRMTPPPPTPKSPGAIVAVIGTALSDLSQAEFADVIREMVRQCVKNGGPAVAAELRAVINTAEAARTAGELVT